MSKQIIASNRDSTSNKIPDREDLRKLFDTVRSIKSRKLKDGFQIKIKKDISKIKKSPNMSIFPDKTNNVYEIPAEEDEKLLKSNITKTYKKLPPKLLSSINLDAKPLPRI